MTRAIGCDPFFSSLGPCDTVPGQPFLPWRAKPLLECDGRFSGVQHAVQRMDMKLPCLSTARANSISMAHIAHASLIVIYAIWYIINEDGEEGEKELRHVGHGCPCPDSFR